jgi:hypothetical protein
MRIREIRRFLDYFIVFVNDSKDMALLEKDKRFSLHAYYRDLKHGFYGKEYKFQCSSGHIKSAKLFIHNILNKGVA